jgi:hypothetical protein
MELETCPYNGHYEKSDRVCERCELGPECHWLFNNDEFSELHERPLSALLASLDLALWLVDSHHPYGTHICHCTCELCAWRRPTEKLLTANSFQPPIRPTAPDNV